MPLQPIIKVLTASGICSRRRATAIIKRGGIAVNGKTIESFTTMVDPALDKIAIDGKNSIIKPETGVYLMLNKPRGVVSSTRKYGQEETIIDLVPEKYRCYRIYPVGRLDKDSSGLILLTNDGDLTFKLTHPRFEQEKEYLIRINGVIKPEEITRLEQGIELEDGKTSPAGIKQTEYPPFNYSVTIHEGKKREIRRMFSALGYTVLELKRIRFANLKLGRLPESSVRALTQGEISSLKNSNT